VPLEQLPWHRIRHAHQRVSAIDELNERRALIIEQLALLTL